MSKSKLDQVIVQMEHHLECWKQFNQFFSLARSKKFSDDDESQFLELKSVLAQELEMIFSAIETSSPSREEILALISGAPSVRALSELSDLRQLENQWHKIYIGWQSLLGQLKVQQRQKQSRSFWGSLFKR